jgi:hypothetical protein
MSRILFSMQELIDRVLEIIPSATFDEDNEGQLVIYTGLVEVDDNATEMEGV